MYVEVVEIKNVSSGGRPGTEASTFASERVGTLQNTCTFTQERKHMSLVYTLTLSMLSQAHKKNSPVHCSRR